MKKMLFIDRDGTIIKEPTDNFQVDRPEKLEFMPGVIGALREITGNTDFRLVMVSNQDGLGSADFPMEDFMLPQTLMLKVLESEGIVFDEICIDPSRPEEYSRFRKPGIGMVEKYLNEYLDTENSYVIGDRETDMQLAAHMGIKGIWLGEWRETDLPVVLHTDSWREITRFIVSGSRKVRICRKTAETRGYCYFKFEWGRSLQYKDRFVVFRPYAGTNRPARRGRSGDRGTGRFEGRRASYR